MKQVSTRNFIGRITYFGLLIIFVICIIIQMFWVGMATFVNPTNWKNHVEFVHQFGFLIPIVMIAFAYLGAVPKKVYGQLLTLIGTMFLLYFTANIARTIQWLGALHPVLAILLVTLSILVLFSSKELVYKK
ncbi:hypothetical protein IM538_14710 [Cytobacillus suaedae]|nr:hypothetical protein IM538_14710 [Cytobacillus suaedae]